LALRGVHRTLVDGGSLEKKVIHMNISIIVPTHNNAENIRTMLDNLKKCIIPSEVSWEIIISNNRGNDHTGDVVESFQAHLPVVMVCGNEIGVSNARNKGVEASSGDLLIFTDDDVAMGCNWIRAYWDAFSKQPQGCYFGGPVESIFPADVKIEEELIRLAPHSIRGLDWGEHERLLATNEIFLGINFAVPRVAFSDVGLFSKQYGLNATDSRIGTAGETEFMMRLDHKGYKRSYIPDAKVFNRITAKNMSVKHIMKRRLSAGYEDARLRTEKIEGPFVFGVPRWVYRRYFSLLAVYCFQRIKGRPSYDNYAQLKFLHGYAIGIQDRRRLGKDS